MNNPKGAYGSSTKDSAFRRTWDKEEYEKKARERAKRLKNDEQGIKNDREGSGDGSGKRVKVERELLKAREEKVNLTGMVGKMQIVQASGVSSKQPGYYCKVCDCTIRDSISYLDHINGKKHHQNMNMSLKIKRETVDDVKKKLMEKKSLLSSKNKKPTEYDFEASVKENKRALKDEQKMRKGEKMKLSKEKDSENNQDLLDPEIQKLMGFDGFGTSKK
ncbi:hypothetical protein BB559_003784 [Furculomyces boomerangus]|uniref:Matrin-type domain-containing protein n=1 Tax=Furculomyces boomerangus TaxID=61424 RepID=A0A2T9YIT5_9FUNG|nr:hypothetical protein BB559_003784 [Furculomyces boomerangus]